VFTLAIATLKPRIIKDKSFLDLSVRGSNGLSLNLLNISTMPPARTGRESYKQLKNHRHPFRSSLPGSLGRPTVI
jgi:hypothetical protein